MFANTAGALRLDRHSRPDAIWVNLRPNCSDGTGKLVAQNQWVVYYVWTDFSVLVVVHIAAANTNYRNFDEYLISSQLGQVNLADF
jgi:hypothetical protein